MIEIEESPRYLVRFNFVVFDAETENSPVSAQAFQNALQIWANELPIECATFHEPFVRFPINLFGISSVSSRPDVIQVHIVDLQAAPYNIEPDVLGFWEPDTHELFLDSDSLESDQDRALTVCVHELGHVFGLSHICNIGNVNATTGMLIVPSNIDAKTFVMYPACDEENKCAKLSKLEIEIAKQKLLSMRELEQHECLGLTMH